LLLLLLLLLLLCPPCPPQADMCWWWRLCLLLLCLLCLLLLLLLLLLQSHIAPFERERVQTMADGWRSQWVDSPWTAPLASWPADVHVHRLEGQAGQCIIFSEKLKHGTIPWSSETHERRTLFYKCESRFSCHHYGPLTGSWARVDAPYGMHHGDVGYDAHDPELTEEQRAIVEFSPEWSGHAHHPTCCYPLLLPLLQSSSGSGSSSNGN
jgi:hypothetical protein